MRVYQVVEVNMPAGRIFSPALLLFICATAVAPAGALISAGDEYQIDSSAHDNGGGAIVYGGEYASMGAIGQHLSAEGPETSVSGVYVNRTGFYDPPHLSFQKGRVSVINFNSGSASLNLPEDAVIKEVFDITLNHDPASHPQTVAPGIISYANSKMERSEGSWSRLFPGQITEMYLFDEQDAWKKPFAKNGTLSMRYKDSNGDGILDGSDPIVRVDTIRPWVLDEARAMWIKLPEVSFDKTSKVISVPVKSPGVYALLGMIDESVKDTYAFPVPFRPDGPHAGTGAGQTGTEADGITFTNIPQVGSIEIYTLDGRLVRKLAIPVGLLLPKLKWDMRTAGGNRTASGVYIWRVVSGSSSRTGKLMVIW